MHQLCILSPLPFYHYIHVVLIKMQQPLMTSTSGIHLNTIMYDDNEEYGKFVSKLKILFKTHKKTTNLEGNAFWALLLHKF